MIQYQEPHVWKRKLNILRESFLIFNFFDKDDVGLGKGKVEEKIVKVLLNLDQQKQKEAGSSTKVTGRRVGREMWLQKVYREIKG